MRAPKPRAEQRLAILSPTQSPPQSVAISPDASTAAILADDKLWLRKLSEFTATEVAGTEGARAVFWSPDNTHLGFEARGRLWRVAVPGGTPISIGDVATDFTPSGGAAWTLDGRIVFSTGTSTLMQMPADGSAPASAMFALDPQKDVDLHQPSLLPDGKSVLFVIHPVAGLPYEICVFADGARRSVFTSTSGSSVSHPRYSPTGHMLFEMNGEVLAVPFSLETKAITGDPVLVAGAARQPSVSADGTIVMLSGSAGTALKLTEVDVNGKPGAVIGQRRAVWPRLSPDGRYIAAVVGFGELTDIWIFDRTRNTERRLTFEATQDFIPTWSPDGKFIVYSCGTAVCARPADGGGTRVELVTQVVAGQVTPDGRRLVFRRRDGDESGMHLADLSAAGLSAPAGPSKLLVAQRGAAVFDISPDGRYVAYSSRDNGVDSVFVTRFPEADGKWEVPVRLATNPRWNATGDRLFVFDELTRLVEVPVDLSTSFAAGIPEVRISGLGAQSESGYAPAPDGKSFMIPLPPSAIASQVNVLVIRDWVPK